MKYMNHDTVDVIRPDANFDMACNRAWAAMLLRYGINDDGNSTQIDFARSTDTPCIEFSQYKKIGSQHWYIFEIWTERQEGETSPQRRGGIDGAYDYY